MENFVNLNTDYLPFRTFCLTRNMTKDIQLIWTKHPRKEYSERQYLDYVISGETLREHLRINNNLSVTTFGFFQNEDE